MPDNDKLVIKAEETNYLFNQAKEKMRLAVRNGLGVTYAASEGPPTYGVGTTVSNTDLNACQDVQNTIITLSAVVTGPIGIATLTSLPTENVELTPLVLRSVLEISSTSLMALLKISHMILTNIL